MANRSVVYDEAEIIECYEEYETARVVAELLGVSCQTVYRVLIRNGIPRTHRHEKDKHSETNRVSNCRTKYCPALIAMLVTLLNMRPIEIQRILDAKNMSAVTNVISRKGLQKKRVYAKNANMDAIERDYLAGASTYELADKYGVYHSTISKWMKKRGHVRGKGYAYPGRRANSGLKKGHETATRNALERWKKTIEEKSDGTVELVSYKDKRVSLSCRICGCTFERYCSDIRKYGIHCPSCKEKESLERKRQNDERRRLYEEKRLVELAKAKVCVCCGSIFHSESETAKYCSKKCQKKENGKRNNYGNDRKRARHYGAIYEPGITLDRLIERDGNICQICGLPCDKEDLRWGYSGPLYPTRDHIVAMANGGDHVWSNMQLAHMVCNSIKRDLCDGELTEEVFDYARETVLSYIKSDELEVVA